MAHPFPLLTLLLLCGLPPLAAAAEPPIDGLPTDRPIHPALSVGDFFGPQAGEVELAFAAAGTNDRDFDGGGFNLQSDLSYYFTETVSAGIRQGFELTSADESRWNADTALFGQYHFGQTPLRPYVGAAAGFLYGDDVNDTFYGGPEAGLRYYLKPETFLFGRVQYQFLFDSGDDEDDRFDDGRFFYTFGLGVTF
jgi:hypothetical protein